MHGVVTDNPVAIRWQRQVRAFVIVGTAAALTHLLVVSLLVPLGVHPLVANIVGFAVAFAVSFQGHARWTFPAGTARPLAMRRFFAVAVSSFAANELLYAMLLSWTSIDFRVALVFVLVAVSLSTFLISKFWAFADVGN